MSPSDVFTPLSRRFSGESARSLHELREYAERVSSRHRASRWSDTVDALRETADKIGDTLAQTVEIPRCRPLLEAMHACQVRLLSMETAVFIPVEVDFSQPLSFRDRIDVSNHLRAQERFLDNEASHAALLKHAICNLLRSVVTRLPTLEDSPFSVPLIDLIPNPAAFVEEAMRVFFDQECLDAGLFATLSNQLYANLCEASGFSPNVEHRKPLVWPTERKLGAVELVSEYLHDTPLHDLLLAPCPFELPDEQRFSGHWIIAPPGRGKTTLLQAMFIKDLDADASIIVIDSKGDLIEPVKNLESLKDRLALIEPSADHAFALNPLDVSNATVMQVVNLIEYIMAGLLDAKFTALQSTLFRNVVPAMIEAFEQPTLETFKSVMVTGLPRESLPRLNPYSRQFFENSETGFYSKTYDSTRKEVVWRLDYLMTNPVLRSMFSATHTKLDIGKEMDAGKVIIINNSKAILGDEGAEFFGRFFVALIARAAQQRSGRPSASKKPCYVYIDECQTVISKDTRIPTLLDECRSQKIALILAHQRTAQLSAPVLDAVANCAIRMANSDDEARYLADKLRTNPEFLRSLPRGTFAAFVRDTTQSAISINVPHVRVDRFPQMTDAEQRELRHRMQTQFTAPAISSKPAPAAPSAAPAPPPQPPDLTQTPPSAKPDPKSPAAKTTTEVAKPRPAPVADDPQTGDHTEPASKWDKK